VNEGLIKLRSGSLKNTEKEKPRIGYVHGLLAEGFE
jgi:hypothetical protein